MTKQKLTFHTRSGSQVIIYTRKAGGGRPIHGAYLVKDGEEMFWVPVSWRANGKYLEDDAGPSKLDLIDFHNAEI